MVVHVVAYGAELSVLDHETRYEDSEERGAYEKHVAECLALTCAGFDRAPCKLQILAARAINRELDQYDFSHYLPREAVAVLERIGEDGHRGEKGKDSLQGTINRITKEFVVAACRVLEIDQGPYPTKPECKEPDYWARRSYEEMIEREKEEKEQEEKEEGDDGEDIDEEEEDPLAQWFAHDAAVDAWYDKCPLKLTVDYVQGEEGQRSMCVVVYLKSNHFVRQAMTRKCNYVGGNFGPGVDSRRLDMDVSEDQKRAVATVLEALHLKTKRPPGWIRISVATGY